MKNLQVNQDQENTRLDHFLVEQLNLSRKKVKQLIDEGRIFLGDRKIIIASWKLHSGDQLKVLEEQEEMKTPRRERYLKIYHEDAYLLVVEKPPGVACEASAQTLSSTLVDDINDYLKRVHPDKPHPYIGLMHRLDRETSGVMVYTLSHRANKLSEQFKKHSIKRSYLALVEGSVANFQGQLASQLVKDSRGKKVRVGSSKNQASAKQAFTEFFVKERYDKITLLELKLKTGRTHQIRAHLANMGHPVVGDKLYGSRIKAPRHLLHASYLEFIHPLSGKKMAFRSKAPKDFQKFLERFRGESLRLKN
ncbi:MAG: RluA family pseudouridine synthase [Deltaproteobacteria bacterium]|nr:RluA family pseudouridine synthase [Deltaproteobacteria bacterium]